MTAPLTPERLAEVRARNDRLLPNIYLQCPVEVADESGYLQPCGKASSTWRWYDGDDHEPMLMACCYGHETNGAEELAAVLANDVPDLLDAVERMTERAERADAALARVEALAEDWERTAGEASTAWSVYGPQKASVPFVVQQIREAMEGKP